MSYADGDALGVDRSIDPPGVLPYIARRLDAATPARDHEVELAVELLHVDATSYRTIRERCDGDGERMAALIADVVRERGKLQNPWTGSGGVLAGRATRVGARYWEPGLQAGELVVPLASLVAIPLALDAVGPLAPHDPHVPARALDVYPAASHARTLGRPGRHVLVLGAGSAGLLAAAAAHEAVGSEGLVTAVDLAPRALERIAAALPATHVMHADAADSVGVVRELHRRADLTLVCTSVPGCEGTAILATQDSGAVLFFSTATSFTAAALGADSISSRVQLVIPNGYTDDRGEYALELLRRRPGLRAGFEAAA